MAEGGVTPRKMDVDGDSQEEPRICIIGDKLKNDADLLDSIKVLNIPVDFCDSVYEYRGDIENDETTFVLDDFESEEFNYLKNSTKKICGPTIIKQCAVQNADFPVIFRPVYSTSMRNIAVCFTGFSHRDEMHILAKLVHCMSGSIRQEYSSKVTHLVSNTTFSSKYKYAAAMGTPIMSAEWIYKTWDRRNVINCHATDQDLIQYKLKLFFNCRIAFVGFSAEDQKDMEKRTEENGGTVTTQDSDTVTHIVVDEQNEIELKPEFNAYVVKAEWFWATIQMDVCADEKLYTYKHYAFSPPSNHTPTGSATQTPISRFRKRKRLRETLGQLAQLPESALNENRKSTETLDRSLSSSFLDQTMSPENILSSPMPQSVENVCLSPNSVKSPVELKNLSGRQQVCLELLQTENNYVGILNMIITRFKEPVEQQGLLSPTEINIIFGNLIPILEVHKKLRDDLSDLMMNWREECGIGSLILKHSPDLLKAYPSFVNFFETTKETLAACDKTKDRFHAFLKIQQKKAECGRQSLSELLIQPVQRLPRIILLLKDIVKHSNKSNPDYPYLEEAITSLDSVCKNINEYKRKTEEHVAMFDIINDIENCPPNLLSSHRAFITKVDVIALGNALSSKGDNLSIFLFSDMMEICKKRTKVLATMKSPGITGVRSQTKMYKHVELLPLADVKRVLNIVETEECKNVFALVCRSNQELKEKLYSFALASPDVEKINFLKLLSRHVANTFYRTDVENFMTTVEAQKLDIETNEMNTNSLSKAMSRLASKTSRKVGRAFSFNRTPRKLKRAMSAMISPFETPLQLNQHHLSSSSTNLQAVDLPSSSHTAKVSKKGKSSSYGASAAKLL